MFSMTFYGILLQLLIEFNLQWERKPNSLGRVSGRCGRVSGRYGKVHLGKEKEMIHD